MDSFLGKAKADTMLGMRLHEVALYSWDVYIARDRMTAIPDDMVSLVLPVQLRMRVMRKPAALEGKQVQLRTTDGQWQRVIDFRGEKPAVEEALVGAADITIEAPPEEICRLLGGRHHVPGSLPRLTCQGGSYQELTALSLFGG